MTLTLTLALALALALTLNLGIYARFSWANHCCEPSAVNSKGPGQGEP